jgi:peptidoglycan/xylan/chitin deacetylase (PgdA/CDA1 family)
VNPVSALREAENQGIDHVLGYTQLANSGGSSKGQVALTFDDGPGPYTRRVMNVLLRNDAPGTFFEVGFTVPEFHTATAALIKHGFPIGDHTNNHVRLAGLPKNEQRDQILQQAEQMGRYGAPFPRLFRPPDEAYDSNTLAALRELKMLMVLWTVDTDDWTRPGTDAIVRSALTGAHPGAIVLLHDGGGDRSQTVAALPRIIKGLRKRRFQLVTVPQLMTDDPPPAGPPPASTVPPQPGV